jgi:sugar phosphate isomerase/epimerase
VAEAEALLTAYPKLRFLPDTGHLTVAGEDVVKVIERNFGRIEAVHLKDWRAEFGRAYPFYSQGFTELGRGDVCLVETLRCLKDRGFEGWLVVEQDVALDAFKSAADSQEWLLARFKDLDIPLRYVGRRPTRQEGTENGPSRNT